MRGIRVKRKPTRTQRIQARENWNSRDSCTRYGVFEMCLVCKKRICAHRRIYYTHLESFTGSRKCPCSGLFRLHVNHSFPVKLSRNLSFINENSFTLNDLHITVDCTVFFFLLATIRVGVLYVTVNDGKPRVKVLHPYWI